MARKSTEQELNEFLDGCYVFEFDIMYRHHRTNKIIVASDYSSAMAYIERSEDYGGFVNGTLIKSWRDIEVAKTRKKRLACIATGAAKMVDKNYGKSDGVRAFVFLVDGEKVVILAESKESATNSILSSNVEYLNSIKMPDYPTEGLPISMTVDQYYELKQKHE